MTLGQRIQQIRIEHGLSQEQFAEKLGTTRQTVSRWELDQTFPEIAKIVLISRIFSVSTDSILKDGISTFDVDVEHFTCGVYRGSNCEIVETEMFSLVIYCSSDKNILGAMEMSRYVQSKNPLNLKYTQYRICFSEWSVAKRRKTDSRAAVRLRFFGSRLTSLCN